MTKSLFISNEVTFRAAASLHNLQSLVALSFHNRDHLNFLAMFEKN